MTFVDTSGSGLGSSIWRTPQTTNMRVLVDILTVAISNAYGCAQLLHVLDEHGGTTETQMFD